MEQRGLGSRKVRFGDFWVVGEGKDSGAQWEASPVVQASEDTVGWD